MKLGPTYPECISTGTLGHNLPQPLCSVKTSNYKNLRHFLLGRQFSTNRIFGRAFFNSLHPYDFRKTVSDVSDLRGLRCEITS